MTLTPKILVVGARGQIGSALLKNLTAQAIGVDSNQLNLTNLKDLETNLGRMNPSAIVNAAAYTQVDKAESERELAYKINAGAPEVLAKFCRERNLPFIHYSTDYVYSGAGLHFMSEDEKYEPSNFYGESKRAGDEKIQEVGGKFLIFRTCWVYDSTGKNFMNTILRLAGEREELRVVNDQIGSPSYAPDLANLTLSAFSRAMEFKEFPSGIYHLCNSGVASWWDFAEEIVARAKKLGCSLKCKKILPIPSEEYLTPAKRPKNSRLSTEKVKRVFGISAPSWQDGLQRCLQGKYAIY